MKTKLRPRKEKIKENNNVKLYQSSLTCPRFNNEYHGNWGSIEDLSFGHAKNIVQVDTEVRMLDKVLLNACMKIIDWYYNDYNIKNITMEIEED